MKTPAEYWMNALALPAHPEGGYFKETIMFGLAQKSTKKIRMRC